ncbi:hypothetical protein NLG97_g491 [Lecanicillium saksenae]|uniref:Uncharacterized protein n=1 Tax=Lecanicillium saksenae TaxID=468837 RepID=A0ACC1R6F4_9HYPO|nr:hypothetical protein NLG97_g491 [Lecanicillium saksenae]
MQFNEAKKKIKKTDKKRPITPVSLTLLTLTNLIQNHFLLSKVPALRIPHVSKIHKALDLHAKPLVVLLLLDGAIVLLLPDPRTGEVHVDGQAATLGVVKVDVVVVHLVPVDRLGRKVAPPQALAVELLVLYCLITIKFAQQDTTQLVQAQFR